MSEYERSTIDRRNALYGGKTQLKTLSDRHHSILRLHLLGYDNRDIAQKLGVSETNVSVVTNSNLGKVQRAMLKAELDNTAMEAAKQIRSLAPKAVQLLEEIMDNQDAPAAVRLSAAKDALDRAGFGAAKKVDVNSMSISLSSRELEDIKERAMQRAQESGILIDITPEEADTLSIPSY